MRRVAQGIAFIAVGALGWLTIAWLVLVEDVGSRGLTSPHGVSALVLFFGVPLLTFLSLERRWHAPFFAIEAAVGWGMWATFLSFVDPGQDPPMWQVVLFLAAMTVAVSTLCTAVARAVAQRRANGYSFPSFVDARRRGYLAASGLIAMAMLAGLDVMSPVPAALLVAVCVLVETIICTRSRTIHVDGKSRRNTRSIRSIQGS